ncbi:damage-inducible protein DinB [Pseudoxanthomonas yeongjuensis]|uniref:DinB family protein n=1 Tax=Pseudoxanthomonas yeongjuensis TaxID=377616 RepID=UPI00139071E1|nr:DinB family protein [Pseudoxanthomonas yeongjuensis]KAF1715578.1 damage-inducible protein DinB [Pseudoxanthomonas yeongjuensis]
MTEQSHFALLADYNRWMNRKLYAAAATLDADALAQDRGAFFGSILGTLNHLVVADTIWLKRFASHPAHVRTLRALAEVPLPNALDAVPFPDFAALRTHREWLDALIVDWTRTAPEGGWNQVLSYGNTRGVPFRKRMDLLMLHFFNHQTHHRGQATTLLSQADVDVGETDLRALLPDEAED